MLAVLDAVIREADRSASGCEIILPAPLGNSSGW